MHRDAQHATPLFVSADVDELKEIGASVRYTPTVAFYERGRKARLSMCYLFYCVTSWFSLLSLCCRPLSLTKKPSSRAIRFVVVSTFAARIERCSCCQVDEVVGAGEQALRDRLWLHGARTA